MRQLVHLSLRPHSSTRYDYCMISMKRYAWILTRRKLTSLYMNCVRSMDSTIFLITHLKSQTDPLYMLSAPRRHEILSSPIRNKVFACLATRFNVKKDVIQSVIKLDRPITQYGRVTRLEGGDLMIGRDLVQETEGSRDASFVRVEFRLFIHAAS